MDVSSYLPQSVITAMGYSRESICCLAVRQSEDASFYAIAHDCPTEDGLVSLSHVNHGTFLRLIHPSIVIGPHYDNGRKHVLVALWKSHYPGIFSIRGRMVRKRPQREVAAAAR